MQTRILRRTAVAGVVVLGVAAAGCGGSTEATESSAGAKPVSSGGDGGGDASGGGAKKVKVGEETTLQGRRGAMKVAVLKVEDPMKAPPARGLVQETPRKGNRFVGVHVRLTNMGDELYKDSLLNGSRLTTDVAKAARPTILLGGKCKSKFGTSTRIPVGDTKTGCLPFQVKKKAKVSAFELTLDSGFGPETGTWSVR